jgi:7,8-dihydropterin-6-yl-methyl-4-(beta-D-ribofuranosyl)aminobenzene 5'-phosphate synthase
MAGPIRNGSVLIAGCSHATMADILKVALQFENIAVIVGGMNGFSQFELLEDMELICPARYTAHEVQIKSCCPIKCIVAGAGKVIEI